jgi:GDP-4-dehydro-6-deoxy-D-mannose reductase
VSFRNNTNIFLNLLDAARKVNPEARILSVGSSEEYGAVKEEDLPLREDSPLNPVSPYAVARVSQELLSKVYADGYGLDIVMTRSFNHIGTGQKDIFALSSFARQLAKIKKAGLSGGELTVGDVSVVRDFIDIRDVVEAYNVLFERGRRGEIYNVCSGRGNTLKAIIDKMARILEIDITLAVNKNLVRPADNKIVIGSNDKLRRETGWKKRYSLDESLRDLLAYWMAR